MLNIEISQGREGEGWVATFRYTLKNELVNYEPAKIREHRIESDDLLDLMSKATRAVVFMTSP
jgi:hypothetical protein